MSNTTFFKKIIDVDTRITYRDILSESFRKHSLKDVEYALSAGTANNQVTGKDMLEAWQKPWLWLYSFCTAFIISFALYLMTSWFPSIPSFGWTSVIFATLVTPVPFMIFLWELNIPRDISFLSLIGCFVTGGILSIFFSAILISVGISGESVWWAPLAEEPGKLVAAYLLLRYAEKRGNKIYGCTGLVIGAGVGAGFTVFETFGYALNALTGAAEYLARSTDYPIQLCINFAAPSALYTVFIRSVPCLAAHLLYCVPYVSALSLAYRRTRSWEASFKDGTFKKYFIISIILHALWNCFGGISGLPGWCIRIAISSGSFYAVVRMIQQSFEQIIREIRVSKYIENKPFPKGEICVYSNSASNGIVSRMAGDSPILIGRDGNVCSLCYPENTKGVSRKHCRIISYDSDWYLQDMDSRYGTFISVINFDSVKRILPGESIKLSHGDRIYLGSENIFFTVSLR